MVVLHPHQVVLVGLERHDLTRCVGGCGERVSQLASLVISPPLPRIAMAWGCRAAAPCLQSPGWRAGRRPTVSRSAAPARRASRAGCSAAAATGRCCSSRCRSGPPSRPRGRQARTWVGRGATARSHVCSPPRVARHAPPAGHRRPYCAGRLRRLASQPNTHTKTQLQA